MKLAETEGTDINFIAETEGTDITQLAESEGTDLSNSEPRSFQRLLKYCSLATLLVFGQTLLAANINLYTNDGEHFKGVITSNQKIDFIEGYVEKNTGYFILNNSLIETKASDEGTGNKASDEGTGVPASDEGTGGIYASDEGTGAPASDEGTGAPASDEGTGEPASDEGTGGIYASDEGTGRTSNQLYASVLTLNWNCSNNSVKTTAQLESSKGLQQLEVNQIIINGTELNCN